MNSLTINWSRVVLLIKQYFLLHKEKEPIFWLIMVVVYAFFRNAASASFAMNVSGMFFAAALFKQFKYTPAGIHYLMIPITQLEKIIAAFILSSLYFFVASCISYFFGNLLGTLLFNSIFNLPITFNWDFFIGEGPELLGVFCGFLTIQSVFALGALIFKNNPKRKTIASLIGISILLSIIESVMLRNIFQISSYSANIQQFILRMISQTTSLGRAGVFVAQLVFTAYIWTICYFKLKEKEV